MKTLIIFILTINFSFAQSDREKHEINARMQSLFTTEFTNMRMNFVTPRVQDFLEKRMELTIVGEPEIRAVDSLFIFDSKFIKHVSSNNNTLHFTYNTKPEGNEFIIQSCEINGNFQFVVEFFIKFWNTTLNFADVKRKETVVNYWLSDRAALTIHNGVASIRIAKSN